MPYKDKERKREWQWRYDSERRGRMRLGDICPSCGAPLLEEESIYCINCKMHLWRLYPSKKMRGGASCV